jgi:hypothetical protein
MNWLKTARVVIIDDNKTEGQALNQVLARKQIGTLFIQWGDVDNLPEQPLVGTRLLCLDMYLADEDDDETVLATLMTAVKTVIAETNGPYVLVGWTQHPHLVDKLAVKLAAESPRLAPLTSIPLDKTDFINIANGAILDGAAEALWQRIEAEITGNSPFHYILGWEQSSHDATTETVGMLSGLTDRMVNATPAAVALQAMGELAPTETIPNEAGTVEAIPARAVPGLDLLMQVRKSKRTSLDALLAALALASAGSSIQESFAKRALTETLNLLLADQMEQIPETNTPNWPSTPGVNIGELAGLVGQNDLVADLNAALLVGKPRTALSGGVYVSNGWHVEGGFPIGTEENSLVHLPSLMDQLFSSKPPVDSVVPVLVDISPVCDYAQGKVRFIRLAAGLLVATDRFKVFQGAHYIDVVGPMRLEYDGITSGIYHLVTHVGQVMTIPPDRLGTSTAAFRLRDSVVFSTQSRFTAHSGRPGYVSVVIPKATK